MAPRELAARRFLFALLISTALEGYAWTVYAVLGLAFVAAGNVLVIRGGRR